MGGAKPGSTASIQARGRGPDASDGPCLFLVAHGSQPRSSPLRVQLGDCDQLDLRRGATLDVTVRDDDVAAIELALPDTRVSSDHARLERCLGQWCVIDHRSKNGTFVNGVRVERAVLGDGDAIDVGDTIFVFRERIARGSELAYQPPPAVRGMSSMLPALQAQLDELAKMARSPITILIEGETGTGKEVVARAIHDCARRKGELVAVNCGGIPADRIEAELFGWRRGAFTGALADHAGLVRAADSGTLMLDEVGDLPLAAQATLLRVLQEREVLPIAATRPVGVDLRVVAATHRPLDAMAARGAFRADLLARLSGYRFHLAPLRARREDLGLVLADVLARHRDGQGCRATVGALRVLLRHDWPTNVRGLEQAITRALVTCAGGVIDVDDLPAALAGGSRVASVQPAAEPPSDEVRRERLIALLQEHHGNVAAVARAMGKARMQIHRWLKRYRLAPGEFRAPHGWQ